MRRYDVVFGTVAVLAAITVSTAPAAERLRESFTGTTHTLSARSTSGRVSATLQSAGRSTDGFWSYAISSRHDGASRTVTISSLIQQAFELHVTDAIDRATVVGWASRNGVYAFNVVDLAGARLMAQVPCYKPVVSPSGRYIAFVQWFPPHLTNMARQSAVYRIADVARIRRESAILMTDYYVGTAVYPMSPLTIPQNSPSTDPSLIHQIVRDFVWKDDAHVKFTDLYRNHQSTIQVTLAPTGITAVTVH